MVPCKPAEEAHRQAQMSSRDDILARVRLNQPAAQPLPEIPMFDALRSASLATFSASLERMGGRVVTAGGPRSSPLLSKDFSPTLRSSARQRPK